MESQPTIETAVEPTACQPTVLQKPASGLPEEIVPEAAKSVNPEATPAPPMPDFLRLLSAMMPPGISRPSSDNTAPEKTEKSDDGPSASNTKESRAEDKTSLSDIIKLAMTFAPILAKAFSSSSDGDRVGFVPSFHSRKAKTNKLVLQIIVEKWTFLVTRSGKNEYKVSYRQDTIFQKKTVSSKGLYTLLKTLTDILAENVHFGLIFNKSTLETRVLEPAEMSKKTLKAHLRYFLCLL